MPIITPDQAHDNKGHLPWRAVYENRRGCLTWRHNVLVCQDIRRRMCTFNFPKTVQEYITQEKTDVDELPPAQQLSGNRNARS